MNVFKKLILFCGVVLTTDVGAFGHIDIHEFRQTTMPITATHITACATDPECESELSGLSPEVIKAARYVTICWDIPKCEKSSVVNFATICQSDSECRQMVDEITELNMQIFEECMLSYECKTSFKSCWKNYSCRSNFKACVVSPTDDNPACEKAEEVYPEGFLEKFIE